MMNEYDHYANVIRSIIKHDKNQKYDTLIPIFLNKMYPEYFNNRNDKKYNLDNLYKKYLPIYNFKYMS